MLSDDAARGADYAARHGTPGSTTSIDDLLGVKGLHAVYISTTNEKHHPQALAAGKHVLCEKPLAMTTAEAADRVRAAGVDFATNHHLRNAGAHLAIRDLIVSGRSAGC